MNILFGNLLRFLQLGWQIDYGTAGDGDGSVSRHFPEEQQGATDDYGDVLWWLPLRALHFHSFRMTGLNRYVCQNVSTPAVPFLYCGRTSVGAPERAV